MELSPWQKEIETTLATHEEAGLATKDLRFFHVDTLLKYAGHCEKFSTKCPSCRSNMKIIETTAKQLDEYLSGSRNGRIQYEKIFFEIEKHLKTTHKLAIPKYQISLYSFIGLLIGTLFGVMLAQVVNPNALDKFLLSGLFIGLIIGRIVGNNKEKTLKSEGRYL